MATRKTIFIMIQPRWTAPKKFQISVIQMAPSKAMPLTPKTRKTLTGMMIISTIQITTIVKGTTKIMAKKRMMTTQFTTTKILPST